MTNLVRVVELLTDEIARSLDDRSTDLDVRREGSKEESKNEEVVLDFRSS